MHIANIRAPHAPFNTPLALRCTRPPCTHNVLAFHTNIHTLVLVCIVYPRITLAYCMQAQCNPGIPILLTLFPLHETISTGGMVSLFDQWIISSLIYALILEFWYWAKMTISRNWSDFVDDIPGKIWIIVGELVVESGGVITDLSADISPLSTLR